MRRGFRHRLGCNGNRSGFRQKRVSDSGRVKVQAISGRLAFVFVYRVLRIRGKTYRVLHIRGKTYRVLRSRGKPVMC